MISAGLTSYTKTFRYRMWLSDTATEVDENGTWKYNNMSFTVRVNVYASNEEILAPLLPEQDPNPPVLVQGQIPVVYDSTKASWVKVDTSSEWYNYSNQEWANAVTVTEAKRETIMNASAGTPISIDDINTMWVWIPRYEYMYTNLGNQYAGGNQLQPREIKVKFIDGTSTTSSDSTNYKVHPAFTFGTDELEGLWYGKFETSTTDNACNSNASTSNCDKLMASLQVKPNISSWRYVKPSNLFTSIQNMQLLYASTYGFSTTNLDIHMSKNSEWGAVAYLSQSKYGNEDYTEANKEVYQNKSSSYITGMSNGTPSTTTYNTQVTYEVEGSGTGASTTGNITGVYDMSGGAQEYVMGYLTTASSTWGHHQTVIIMLDLQVSQKISILMLI